MIALVTGSGKKRVGAAVARLLAERGFDIAVHYHRSEADAANTVRELRGLGVKAEAFRADLASEAEVKQLIESVLARFGRIDLLANCAAIWEPKRLEDITADDVRRHFEVNALGTFLCSQHAGLAMVKQPEGGLIVTVGDWAEARPYPGYAAYFPSKGAVTALTRSLAVELGTRNPNVRVNCVLPGPVMLPPELSDVEKREAIDATLVKREGSPRNVAQAVFSFWENDFITGACLPVDGGRTVFAP
jgi:pteridine reductase